MTDGLLFWLLLHLHLLLTLSLFFLTFIFGYAGSLLLHKLSLVGLPFPSPRDVPDPGIKPVSPALAGGFFTTEPQGKPHLYILYIYIFFLNYFGFQKNISFCFVDYAKAFDCVDHNKLENSSGDGNTRPPYLPPEKSVCRSRSNN